MASQILQFIILIVPLLIAVTLHEVAHGYAALQYGDPTAKNMGRLSLNPITHLDPFGSVILPALLIFSGSPAIFGYAKPVPVNFANLNNPRTGTIVVAVAGVATNLACAAASGLLYRLISPLLGQTDILIVMMIGQILYAFCIINIILAVFNLIPIPPLDGSRILSALLPEGARQTYDRIGPFGILLLLILLMTNSLDFLISFLISPLIKFLTGG